MSRPEVVARQMPQYGIELPYRFEATDEYREEMGLVFIPMKTLEALVEKTVNTTTEYVQLGLYETQALETADYIVLYDGAPLATQTLVDDYPHLFNAFENAVDGEAARIRKSKKRKPREATIRLDEGLKARLQTNNDTLTLPVLEVSVFTDLGAR
jgi:hypothetical protein